MADSAPDNRSWAQRTFIPEDMGHKVEFIVNSHLRS